MIERKDGETDASWIGRLEAAYKALIPACISMRDELLRYEESERKLQEKLKQAQDDHTDFIGFWGDELSKFPCMHDEAGHEAHKSTPPMMWAPELLGCIIQRAVKDRLAQNVAENPIAIAEPKSDTD